MENKKNKVVVIRLMLLIIPLIIILILSAVLIKTNAELRKIRNDLKADEEYISAKNSRVFTYYGEKDVVNIKDPTYGDTWIRALTTVPKNEMDFSDVKLENGFKNYYINGEKKNKTGIDVSYHQHDIDWDAVKADGIDFAMLRVGYRGYESGKLNSDERFHEYAKGAAASGIDIGVYFYSQATTVEEAIEEADFVADEISGYDILYPVVFDWEMETEEARTDNVTAQTLNDCAAAFCNRIAEHGYIPMIYSVKRMALYKFDLDQLSGFDFWLAEYRDEPEFPYYFTMWQYASDGKVNGIEGDVDLNMSLIDYSKEKR